MTLMNQRYHSRLTQQPLRLPLHLQHCRQLPLSLPLRLHQLHATIVQCCHQRRLPPMLRLSLLLQHCHHLPLLLFRRLHLLARCRFHHQPLRQLQLPPLPLSMQNQYFHPLPLLLNWRPPLHQQHCHQRWLSRLLRLPRLLLPIGQHCHRRCSPLTLRLPLLLQHYPQRMWWLPQQLHLLARLHCHPPPLLLNRRPPLHPQHCHQLPLPLPLRLPQLLWTIGPGYHRPMLPPLLRLPLLLPHCPQRRLLLLLRLHLLAR
jgi:hypothetical protein